MSAFLPFHPDFHCNTIRKRPSRVTSYDRLPHQLKTVTKARPSASALGKTLTTGCNEVPPKKQTAFTPAKSTSQRVAPEPGKLSGQDMSRTLGGAEVQRLAMNQTRSVTYLSMLMLKVQEIAI